jgi:hypothetical protein
VTGEVDAPDRMSHPSRFVQSRPSPRQCRLIPLRR